MWSSGREGRVRVGGSSTGESGGSLWCRWREWVFLTISSMSFFWGGGVVGLGPKEWETIQLRGGRGKRASRLGGLGIALVSGFGERGGIMEGGMAVFWCTVGVCVYFWAGGEGLVRGCVG